MQKNKRVFYWIKNAWKLNQRNKKEFFFSLFISFFYFSILTGFFYSKNFFTQLKLAEAQQRTTQLSLKEKLALKQLLNLLSGLSFTSIFLSILLIFFGYFYLKSSVMKEFVLRQKEIRIKKLLGATSTQVTKEFYSEKILPISIGFLSGTSLLFFVCMGYSIFSPIISKMSLVASIYSFLQINGFLTLFFILVLIRFFFLIKKKIRQM